MTQRHHLIPVSLYGLDDPCNIVRIEEWQHQKIHEVMNYDRNTYSKMYRAFRKRHNHKLVWDYRMTEDVFRMQSGYLDKFYQLPRGLKHVHVTTMRDIVSHYARLANESVLFCNHNDIDQEWGHLMNMYEKFFMMQAHE